MKTMNKWRAMLMVLTVFAFGAVVTSCDDDDDDPKPTEANYTISGNATGNQVVPAVDGTGAGTIMGTYNPNTRLLTYTNTWTGLTGAPTGGGFYNGEAGVNGSAVGAPWTYDGSATATGTYSGTMTLTEDQEDDLLDGDWYYGYNTTAHGTGEVRGQITATQL